MPSTKTVMKQSVSIDIPMIFQKGGFVKAFFFCAVIHSFLKIEPFRFRIDFFLYLLI